MTIEVSPRRRRQAGVERGGEEVEEVEEVDRRVEQKDNDEFVARGVAAAAATGRCVLDEALRPFELIVCI